MHPFGRTPHRAPASVALVALLAVLTACGPFPTDADGTTDRVRDGELRVGITHNPPWTDTSGAPPGGSEAALMAEFAAGLDAEIDWVDGSEAVLVDALHEGDLDVAIGGFLADTPWTEEAAVTTVYREVRNARGVTEKHVMLTRAGENRFLVTLEEFLRGSGGRR